MIRPLLKVGMAAAVLLCVSCKETLTFPETSSPELPEVGAATADYLWIGPDYKLTVSAKLSDREGLVSVRLINQEWGIDKLIELDAQEYTVDETFDVEKDYNRTEHTLQLVARNGAGGIRKVSVPVNNRADVNQDPGYEADEMPPSVVITKPTVTNYYGLDGVPIEIELEASIEENVELTSVYARVWGETATGEPVDFETSITPSTDAEKTSYHYSERFTIPTRMPGEYQYLVRADDSSGNKTVLGGNIVIGMMDRLYLSDAKNEREVTGQGFDAYADNSAWGMGTLIPMRRIGANLFRLENYYYRNDADDNIRFVAFMGNDRPFGASRKINYTLTGSNTLACDPQHATHLVGNLDEQPRNLPVSQKGYYTITVNLTTREVTAEPVVDPTNPDFSNADKFPGYSVADPWDYMPFVAGGAIVGTSGWAEVDNNTSLYREEEHPFIYSGDFRTAGGVNISLRAPRAALAGDRANYGWFRLPSARNNNRDVYGDLRSGLGPVGVATGGTNYGIVLTGNTDWHASFDLITYRLRVVKK